MTYRTVVTIVISITFICATFDAWWIVSGKFATDSYIPGVYPAICILLLVGLRMRKVRGLWGSPPKP